MFGGYRYQMRTSEVIKELKCLYIDEKKGNKKKLFQCR